jgi:acetyl-CoA acetyltransferase
MSIAIGVEKTYYPDAPEKTKRLMEGGIDQYDPSEWREYYSAAGAVSGKSFLPREDRSIFMDTYAMQAAHHMQRYGTTQRQIAAASAKSHCNGALNSKAQYQFEMSIEAVLQDREISHPLTRAMCAPIGDGAAAVILVSGRLLRTLPAPIQERAIRVLATSLSGGKYRDLNEPGLSRIAAQKAYKQADVSPNEIDLAEVHDATSFCEIYQLEMLGLCDEGAGGRFIEEGMAHIAGKTPINTSGGLVSKGHPVGATGLSMLTELTEQLRGEAHRRQVAGAHTALAENGGGAMGFDEAACSVIILQGSSYFSILNRAMRGFAAGREEYAVHTSPVASSIEMWRVYAGSVGNGTVRISPVEGLYRIKVESKEPVAHTSLVNWFTSTSYRPVELLPNRNRSNPSRSGSKNAT